MAMNQRHVNSFIRILAVVGFMLGHVATVFAGNYVVIGNNSIPVNSLSKADLKSIFLGEKVKWSNNKYIKVVVLEDGDVHKDFLLSVVGKTPSQFDKHWMNLVFTGRAAMPQSFAEMPKLVNYVASHPGAIGIVAAGQEGASVKTISIK